MRQSSHNKEKRGEVEICLLDICMLYLLYGDVLYLIDKEVDKIICDNHIEDINISKYELDNTNYLDILEDAKTISLFDDKKVIIVDNAYLFTSEKKALDVTLFEDYFSNYNPNTIIIFKLNEPKLDERKKVVKLIRKYGVVKDYNKDNNITNIVKELFEDYKISNDDIKFLIDRVGNDIYILKQEIDKIKIYKDNDLNITKDDILNLTSENIDNDMFKLMDAIMDNNKEEAISLYKGMLKLNLESISIIIALANKYRLMYQAKELALRGYKEEEIAREVNQTNPKYMYVLIKLARSYTSEKLLELLKELSILDYNIKSGKIDHELAFELFILKK